MKKYFFIGCQAENSFIKTVYFKTVVHIWLHLLRRLYTHSLRTVVQWGRWWVGKTCGVGWEPDGGGCTVLTPCGKMHDMSSLLVQPSFFSLSALSAIWKNPRRGDHFQREGVQGINRMRFSPFLFVDTKSIRECFCASALFELFSRLCSFAFRALVL